MNTLFSFKLVTHNKWLQQHALFRKSIKRPLMFALKIITSNRGLRKNIGFRGGYFRFDYAFAFHDFASWGTGHNNAFETLLRVCVGKKVVFDVGAHIGLCSMPLSKVISPLGMIYAFEPAKTNLKYLSKNITYSGLTNIKVLPNLVGKITEENVPFYEANYITGMNSVVSYKKNDSYKITYKNQISLDGFCRDNGVIPEVIKIDVEGAEIDVLKGAQKTLKIHRPTIILSVHPRHLELLGESVENLRSLIAELKYKILDEGRHVVSNFELREYLLEPI